MGPRKQKKKAEKAQPAPQPAADAKTTDDQPEADNNDSPEMKRSRDDSAAPTDVKDAKKLKSEDNKLSKVLSAIPASTSQADCCIVEIIYPWLEWRHMAPSTEI